MRFFFFASTLYLFYFRHLLYADTFTRGRLIIAAMEIFYAFIIDIFSPGYYFTALILNMLPRSYYFH